LTTDAELTLLTDTGTGNSADSIDDCVVGDIECSGFADVTIERSFDGLRDNGSSQCFKFPQEKVILLLLWRRASLLGLCLVWFLPTQYINDLNALSTIYQVFELVVEFPSIDDLK
jgi:hypothetical protein